MNHRKHLDRKIILSFFLLLGLCFSQSKFNLQLGIGFYSPKIEVADPVPKIGFVGKNLLLNWGMRYQIYPNVRIGYTRSNSYHFGKTGSSNYRRTLSYRSYSFETFYYLKEKVELNFTLAPMLSRGIITVSAKTPTADWDALLTSYSNSSISLETASNMTKRWLGFASHIGARYYFSTLLSLEGKLGYYMSSYSNKNWKLEGEKVNGPPMTIGKLPVVQFNLVVGL